MYEVAPKVLRRQRSEIEIELLESVCGMRWDMAQEEFKKRMLLRCQVLQEFVDAGRRR